MNIFRRKHEASSPKKSKSPNLSSNQQLRSPEAVGGVGGGGGGGASSSSEEEGHRDGVVVAAMECMTKHPGSVAVAEHACSCLGSTCRGTSAPAVRRKELAVAHGAIKAIHFAMKLGAEPPVADHLRDGRIPTGRPVPTGLLREAARALRQLCTGWDVRVDRRIEAATKAGVLGTLAAMLHEMPQLVEVAEEACLACAALVAGTTADRLRAQQQAAIDTQLVPAISRAMAGCRASALVQEWGCKSIQQMVVGEGAAADARRTLGAEGGAIAAALGAMGAHPEAAGVQEHGVRCLQQLCRGSDVGQDVRAEVALALGAMECVRSAIEIHGQNPSISLACCGLVEALCTGADALPRQQKVAEAGALSLLVQLTKTHAAASFAGQAAICVATGGRPELEAKALVAGADQDWLARAGLTV